MADRRGKRGEKFENKIEQILIIKHTSASNTDYNEYFFNFFIIFLYLLSLHV